jgi:phosphonopyruvate decarboxylase
MGKLTTDLLELMDIAWEFFPVEEDQVAGALERAVHHMDGSGLPYAMVMRKGSVAPTQLSAEAKRRLPEVWTGDVPPARETRRQVLLAIQAAVSPDDVLIATTGYTGRELYACEDRPNQLYMVGSMGCAASLGLGLAISQPGRRVIVVDGDGAALMRLGALGTIGHERPTNLVHMLLDNGQHESTGGQATVSPSINFPGVAAAAGYPRVRSLATSDELRSELNLRPDVLSFVHVPTVPGAPEGLLRPKVSPADVAIRLRTFLTGGPR